MHLKMLSPNCWPFCSGVTMFTYFNDKMQLTRKRETIGLNYDHMIYKYSIFTRVVIKSALAFSAAQEWTYVIYNMWKIILQCLYRVICVVVAFICIPTETEKKQFLYLSASIGCFCPLTSFLKSSLPWTFFISDLGTKLRMVSRSISGIATDSPSQRAHDAIITSLWRQNDVATSFRRHNDVIIVFCVRWFVVFGTDCLL